MKYNKNTSQSQLNNVVHICCRFTVSQNPFSVFIFQFFFCITMIFYVCFLCSRLSGLYFCGQIDRWVRANVYLLRSTFTQIQYMLHWNQNTQWLCQTEISEKMNKKPTSTEKTSLGQLIPWNRIVLVTCCVCTWFSTGFSYSPFQFYPPAITHSHTGKKDTYMKLYLVHAVKWSNKEGLPILNTCILVHGARPSTLTEYKFTLFIVWWIYSIGTYTWIQ